MGLISDPLRAVYNHNLVDRTKRTTDKKIQNR